MGSKYSSFNDSLYRRFDVSGFQQLLYLVPEFYSYQWVKKKDAYQQYTLLIDFGEDFLVQ